MDYDLDEIYMKYIIMLLVMISFDQKDILM
jgi:hypothetical protein